MDGVFGEGEERLPSQANAWLFILVMMWLAGKTLKVAGKITKVVGKLSEVAGEVTKVLFQRKG
jgi:hypothetical protein